jgi:phosphoglycolate phosphatase
VATGPTPAAELAAAGADVVLDDLTGFVPWWRGWSAGAGAPAELDPPARSEESA